MKQNKKHWYDFLWFVTPLYLGLVFFNIMFAWIGMIFFLLPLIIAILNGNKLYCNRYCDRGQFHQLLGGGLGFLETSQRLIGCVRKAFVMDF